ncbi:iron ABC transporter permease [Caballeronia sp. LZ035]|uniref:ABC transporter permease n=1 Tax=Caballeronia sp. LZ035 TaxID=3038568 RepID=UPI00285729A8|nr:iron ABC transporter permease [Caballeronia sp. LZ035]MDR5759082.1 iron ABC transporter permease [Caballeronia sp. LZ035]
MPNRGGVAAAVEPSESNRRIRSGKGIGAESRVLSGLVLLAASALVLPPAWILLRTSFVEINPNLSTGAFTFDHYLKLVHGNALASSAWNSMVFALLATVVSVICGASLAWLVERTDVPLKRLAFVTAIISLGTPYILYVTAWLFLLGRMGPVNDLYRALFHSTDAPFNVTSLAGMVFIEGFLWSPLVFLLLSSTFRAANAEMEEAARMSGASIACTVRQISLRLARPAIFALILFVFIRNLESFEVPALVGMPGGVKVLTTEIYRSVQRMPPDVGYASAFSIVLIGLVALLLYFYSKLNKQAERYVSITGKGYRPREFRLGNARWWGGAIVLLNFSIVLVLPLLAILWMAVTPFIRPIRYATLMHLTGRNFAAVLSSPYYMKLALNTLIVAGSVASLITGLTFFAGWITARKKPGYALIDQLVTIPLVFPGLILGLALLELALSVPFTVYGTLWILIFGFSTRYLPYGMRYSHAGIMQIHPELEQAAAVAGASRAQILGRVVTPLARPALVSSWIFIFLIGSKEMSMPLLLAGANSQTIAVALFNLWSNGQSGEVAVLGLFWSLLMTVCSTVFYTISRR